ncbi:MAG: RodZ domain-containing protein [Pontibacterium sp.]
MSQADDVLDEGLDGFDWESLKVTREAAGYTLESLSKELRITKESIVAIESGDVDKLPSPVFAKGYIRQYAALLGLNADEILAAYEDLMSLSQPQTRKSASRAAAKKAPKIDPKRHHDATPSGSSSGGGGKIVVVLLFLLLLAGGGYAVLHPSSPVSGLVASILNKDSVDEEPSEQGAPLSLPNMQNDTVPAETDEVSGLPAVDLPSDALGADTSVLSDSALGEAPETDLLNEETEANIAEELEPANTEVAPNELSSSVAAAESLEEQAAVEEQATAEAQASLLAEQENSAPTTLSETREQEVTEAAPLTSESLGVDLDELAAPVNEPVQPAAEPTERLVIGFTDDCWVEVRDGEGKLLVASIRNAERGVDVSTAALPLNVTLGALSAVAFVEFNGELVELSDTGRGNVSRLTLGE